MTGPRPWEGDPLYHQIDLRALTDRRATLSRRPQDPVYLKLGSNILSFSVVKKSSNPPKYVGWLENLTAPGSPVIEVPMTAAHGDDTIVGRARGATPELGLDDSASREHLRISPMLTQLDFRDLGSTNGTIVFSRELPVAHTGYVEL